MAEQDPGNEPEKDTQPGEQKPGSGEGKPAGQDTGGDKEPLDEDIELDPEKHQVPTRGFIKDRIIERKDKKIDKLEQKGSDEGEEGEGKTDPSDINELVHGAVNEALSPVLGAVQKQGSKNEINSHLADHPERKKYVPLVEKYMNTPGWEGVPADVIFQHLAGHSDAKSKGKKEAEAEAEAKRKSLSQGSGGGRSPGEGKKGELPDVSGLKEDQMEEAITKAKQSEPTKPSE